MKVSDREADAVRAWLERRGIHVHRGRDHAPHQTRSQCGCGARCMSHADIADIAVLYVLCATIIGALAGGVLADKWSRRTNRGRTCVSPIGMSLFLPALFGLGIRARSRWRAVADPVRDRLGLVDIPHANSLSDHPTEAEGDRLWHHDLRLHVQRRIRRPGLWHAAKPGRCAADHFRLLHGGGTVVDSHHPADPGARGGPIVTLAKYHGIIPPMVTPLSGRDTLDQAGLERLIEHILAGGV
ncbi:MAG: hypothetical protein ABI211_13590, partial [Vicinamibacterales bacterium]